MKKALSVLLALALCVCLAAPAFATPGLTVELPYGFLRFSDAMVGGPAYYEGESLTVYMVPADYTYYKYGLSPDTVIRLYAAEISGGAVIRGELRREFDAKYFWSTGPEEIETLPPAEHGYTLLEIEEKDLNTVTRLVIDGVDSLPQLPADKCGDNLTWTLNDGVLTIRGAGDMYNYEADMGGERSVCAPWFGTHATITSLVIENGVTSIGDYAFAGMWDLKSVKTADSVTDPGAWYYKAVLWAAEKGITTGVKKTEFGLNGTLPYDQMITFMCRAAGGTASGSDWSKAAMDWAAENGLTEGLTVAAKDYCPRCDVVYCLWKQMK